MSSRRWKWISEFRNELRWTVVVVVLAGLAVVALWPRAQTGPEPEAQSPSPASSRAVDPALRAQAQLPPCPTAPQGPDQLAGASGTCLADGSPTNLGAAVGGQPTLINVWASWCAPCRSELPVLQQYSEQPGAIRVVGVQGMSDAADGLDMLKNLGVHLPTLHDGDNRIRAALKGPNVWPASFVVTPSGEVRTVHPPVIFHAPEQVRATVERTLGASG